MPFWVSLWFCNPLVGKIGKRGISADLPIHSFIFLSLAGHHLPSSFVPSSWLQHPWPSSEFDATESPLPVSRAPLSSQPVARAFGPPSPPCSAGCQPCSASHHQDIRVQ